MLKVIPVKLAIILIVAIAVIILSFHLLVLTGFVPYNIVWGGRLTDQKEMFIFESISIAVNLFFLCIVLLRAGIIKLSVSQRLIKFLLWVFAILFLLNTIGNLFADKNFEVMVFTPVTALLSLLCARLAMP